MREPHADVERQPAVHLPVVLNVEILVVIDVVPLEQGILLLEPARRYRAPHSRYPKPESSGLLLSFPKLTRALERERAERDGAEVLQLHAVLRLVSDLERVRSPQLRQADRHVVRVLHAEKRRIGVVGRRQIRGSAADAAAPQVAWRHLDAPVDVVRAPPSPAALFPDMTRRARRRCSDTAAGNCPSPTAFRLVTGLIGTLPSWLPCVRP